MLPKEVPRGAPPPDKKLLEHQFVFACIWAFGGCLAADKVSDHRLQFSRWFAAEFRTVSFPPEVRVHLACAPCAGFHVRQRSPRLFLPAGHGV